MPRHAKSRSRPAHPAPPLPSALENGVAAFRAGRFEQAATFCAQRLASAPRDAGALRLMGAARLRLGHTAEAVAALSRAVAIEPGNAEAHGHLGVALRRAGNPAGSVASLRRAVALRPAFLPDRFNLGNALSDLGRHAEAEAAYRDALAIDPNHPGAHNNLGLALLALGRNAAAEAHFRTSLAIVPIQRDANLSLARVLRGRGDPEGALRFLDAAAKAAPDDPAILSERGVVLVELERIDDAVAALNRAVELARDQAAFRVNLGAALCAAGDADKALVHFERADALAPGCADTLANLGHALKQLGRLDEAVAAYDRTLAVDDAHAEARFGRAFCRLLDGDFVRGWPDYRARESMAAAPPTLWRETLPHDLAGKRVLVLRDQGLGDEIFFLRFVPALAARGATVLYVPDPRLGGMIARSGIAAAVADADVECDYRVSVGDLPSVLGSSDVPPSVVLAPLADRVDAMRARLAAFGPPPYIAVAWRAGQRNRRNMLHKESSAARLGAALRPLDARIVIAQRQPRPGELAEFAASLGREALDLSAANDDLETLLALAALADEHVCVSNTTVHLAAACGRHCRILLPHPPEFRWMAEGAESPWFRGTRIYRQAPDGDWSGAFGALGDDLLAAFGPERRD